MPWPAPGFFTGFSTQGQLRQALDDQLARSRAQIGADGVENATIAGGAIAPSKGSVRLFGEGSSADTLVSLDVAAYDEGQLVELRIGDVNQPVAVQHAASPAAGQFSLAGGIDHDLTALGQRIVVQRSGSSWVEWSREGREELRLFPVTAPWSTLPGCRWWLDETGNVRAYGPVTHATLAAASSPIGTFPAGFRPVAAPRIFPVVSLVAGVRELNDLVVGVDGVVTFNRHAGAPAGVAAIVYLDPIDFRANL